MGAKIIHIAHEKAQSRISITSSTMYRSKLKKSSPKQRRALLQLEQKFERSLNAGNLNSKFQPDNLIRRFKEVTYKGVNGTIYAFFRDESTVVFLDFSLARGNGGGTPKIKIRHIIAAQSLNRARAFVEIQRTQLTIPLRIAQLATPRRIASFCFMQALFCMHIVALGTARIENSLRRYAAAKLHSKPDLWLRPAAEPVAASPADTGPKPKQLLFGEIVNALSALLAIEYGDSRRSPPILPRINYRLALTRQLTRQMLFGETVHALSVYFGGTEEKTVRRPSLLALGPRRIDEGVRSTTQYAGRILFGELVATLSIYLNAEGTAAPPPSWSVLSQVGDDAQLSHRRARRILFGEMVGMLAVHLDSISAAAPPPSWSMLSRVGESARLSHQHGRRILFAEMIGILAAYLDVAQAAMPPAPAWADLPQSDERMLLTGNHDTEVVFGEIISTLSAYVGANSSAAPPSTWLTVSEVGESIPLTSRLKEQLLFSEIIAALATCLNTDRTGPSRLWSTSAEIDKGAAVTGQHARRILFGKIVSVLTAYLDPKYGNQGE